jgi:hypothetical protein
MNPGRASSIFNEITVFILLSIILLKSKHFWNRQKLAEKALLKPIE